MPGEPGAVSSLPVAVFRPSFDCMNVSFFSALALPVSAVSLERFAPVVVSNFGSNAGFFER
jgi:threonine/homoserine efflux transporter RhtA